MRTPTTLEGLLDLLIEDERNGKHFNGSTIIYCCTRILVDEVYECLFSKSFILNKYLSDGLTDMTEVFILLLGCLHLR